jgi:hypothetical protein
VVSDLEFAERGHCPGAHGAGLVIRSNDSRSGDGRGGGVRSCFASERDGASDETR